MPQQRFAAGWSDEAVRVHLSVQERQGQQSRSGKLNSFLVDECHDDPAIQRQTELLDYILGQKGHDSAGINKRFQFQAANAGMIEVTCFGENAIALILKNQPCANLLHRIKE